MDGKIYAARKAISVDGIEFLTLNDAGKLIDLLTVEDHTLLLRQIEGP